MQAYPSGLECKFWDSNIAEMNNNIKGDSQNNVGINHNNRSYRFPYLSYSAYGKRSLDISLTQWLLGIQILKPLTATNLFNKWCPSSDFNEKRFIHVDNDVENYVSSHSSFKQYTTLLAWEGVIRDGTVLCDAADWLFRKVNRSTTSFSTHSTSNYYSPDDFARASSVLTKTIPRTFAQCVARVEKCLCTLRGVHSMSTRYLTVGKAGIGELIVRGCWDAVWGLLEDIRRYVRSLVQLTY